MDTPSGRQNLAIINESGLYALIFGSKLESAKRFKHWVTSEVLPAIRKTGAYHQPMTTDQKIQLLAQGNVELMQDAVKKQINSVVGGKNGTRFISSIVSAVQTTPALQECTNPSILSAALLGEALNLSPSPQLGQFYIEKISPYNLDKCHT